MLAKGSHYHVLLGSRSLEKGTAALQDLQSRNLPGTVELVPLDVTDDETIERAAKTVERDHGKLDILVNNAGTVALDPPTLREQMREAFDINATGPAVIVSAFAPLLRKSTLAPPRIVNVSSGAGSVNRRLDPSSAMYKIQAVPYRASKTALSMVTACQFVEYGALGIKVFAYDPGFTKSNLGPPNRAENSGAKPAAEAVRPLIDVLEGRRDDEAGLFLHNTGVYPW